MAPLDSVSEPLDPRLREPIPRLWAWVAGLRVLGFRVLGFMIQAFGLGCPRSNSQPKPLRPLTFKYTERFMVQGFGFRV